MQPLAHHEAQAGGARERAVPMRIPRMLEALRLDGRRPEARAQDAQRLPHAGFRGSGFATPLRVGSCRFQVPGSMGAP